jgi:hypothetical protein
MKFDEFLIMQENVFLDKKIGNSYLFIFIFIFSIFQTLVFPFLICLIYRYSFIDKIYSEILIVNYFSGMLIFRPVVGAMFLCFRSKNDFLDPVMRTYINPNIIINASVTLFLLLFFMRINEFNIYKIGYHGVIFCVFAFLVRNCNGSKVSKVVFALLATLSLPAWR